MKRYRVGVGVMLGLLGVAVSGVYADENPIDLKLSKNGWVVWTDAQQDVGVICAARWEGEKWGAKAQVSSAAHSNIAPAVALDSQGNPWVVWSGGDGVSSSIYYARFDGEKWSEEKLITDVDQREDVTPAIAFNRTGKALVVWGSVDGNSSDIVALEWNGENWGPAATLTAEDESPDMVPAIAFIPEGAAVVAWTGLEGDVSRIFTATRDAKGSWAKESLVENGEFGMGQDLPTLKVEGETLRLFFEQDNQFYASTWSSSGWSREKLVDLSNSFYTIAAEVPGQIGGRAWFAWETGKGLATSFRYNVATHDMVLKQGAKIQKVSLLRRVFEGVGSLIAWVFEPREAWAKGAPTTKVAYGDSIVAGSTGASFVPFWDPAAVNRGVGGQRAINVAGRVRGVFDRVVFLVGTNDMADGRSAGDTNNAINGAVEKARGLGAKKVVVCTNIPRQDIFASAVEDLAQTIRGGSAANKVAETFKPLKKKISRFAIDGVGHLNDAGARKVGGIVKKAAK